MTEQGYGGFLGGGDGGVSLISDLAREAVSQFVNSLVTNMKGRLL